MSLLELPSTREEAWRWSDLSALPDLAAAAPKGTVPASLPWLDCEGPRLLFVDGKPVPIGGTDVVELAELGRIEAFESHPLARLGGTTGWKLQLGRDNAPAGLVQIIHVSTGAADHLPGVIELAEDAQCSIFETFVGEGWANRATAISLERSARLMLSRRILSDNGFTSMMDSADVGEGASLFLTVLAAGKSDTRIDGDIRLSGQAAFAEASGALLARSQQRHDSNFVVRHDAVGGMSRQFWRLVADDTATASVAARVEVARGAQKTDGEQSLKGLLLARAATINLKPELEIFADDVKCAHGATVGELDRSALFYLQSRGISEAEARALLTQAFVADAIDRAGEEAVRDALGKDATRWLEAA